MVAISLSVFTQIVVVFIDRHQIAQESLFKLGISIVFIRTIKIVDKIIIKSYLLQKKIRFKKKS